MVAIGRPHFVKADWVKPGAVVIDCGINSIPGERIKIPDRMSNLCIIKAARYHHSSLYGSN